MATRVCEALASRLRATERTLATADADQSEREPMEAEVQTDPIEALVAAQSSASVQSSLLLARLPGISSQLLGLGLYAPLSWLRRIISAPLLLTYRLSGIGGVGGAAPFNLAGGAARPEDQEVDRQAADAEVCGVL